MVKRRTPKPVIGEEISNTTAAKIEAFASGADKLPNEIHQNSELDPNASRNFKAIRVPFNEFEYQLLAEASKKSGRSMLNFIRQSIVSAAQSKK